MKVLIPQIHSSMPMLESQQVLLYGEQPDPQLKASSNYGQYNMGWILTFLLLMTGCSAGRKVPALPYPASCQFSSGHPDGPMRLGIHGAELSSQAEMSLVSAAIRSRRSMLVVKDCEGGLHSGAASAWTVQEGGKLWTFDLQQDIELTGGKTLDARVLSTYWQHQTTLYPEIEQILPVGEYTVAIHFSTAHQWFPELLFAPAFTLPSLEEEYARLEVVELAGREERDLLEGGVEGMITRDPDVIDYASRRPEWLQLGLAWDKSYVMFVRTDLSSADVTAFPKSIADNLASDVVPGEARAYHPKAWWEGLGQCEDDAGAMFANGVESVKTIRNVRYLSGDPVARGLAERIVALGSGNINMPGMDSLKAIMPGMGKSHIRWSAKALSARELSSGIVETNDGFDAAFIVSVSRSADNPCSALRKLKQSMPMVFDGLSGKPFPLVPMLDVRPTLLLKKGSANLDIDGSGRLLYTVTEQEEE